MRAFPILSQHSIDISLGSVAGFTLGRSYGETDDIDIRLIAKSLPWSVALEYSTDGSGRSGTLSRDQRTGFRVIA